jgi:hypothetical protein
MAMKKILLLIKIVLTLVVYTNGIQAQTTQPKLDQIELMKQALGTWQRDVGKDSIQIAEIQQYRNAFTEDVFLVVNGKKTMVNIWNIGYSSKDDKFKAFSLRPSGNYSTFICSFVSKNKCVGHRVQDFNPEKVLGKFELIYETPTNFMVNWFNSEGVKTGEEKWTKVN